MAELNVLNKRGISKPARCGPVNGSPLGVCINDCEIDYGQPFVDLVHICFSLGCAFAEMRWGKIEESEPANTPETKLKYSIAS